MSLALLLGAGVACSTGGFDGTEFDAGGGSTRAGSAAVVAGAGGSGNAMGLAGKMGAGGRMSSSGGSGSLAGGGGSVGGGAPAAGGAPIGGMGAVGDAGSGGVSSSVGGAAGQGNPGDGGRGAGGAVAGGGGSGGRGVAGGSTGAAGRGGGSAGVSGSTGMSGGLGSDGLCATTGGGSCGTVSCPSGLECGCYTVNGLGANKAAILAAGGNLEMLASAMMETETMTADYRLGDGKTGDSFNAGVTKQNWGMARQCHPAWQGMSSSQYSTSTAMNGDRALDATVYKECWTFFGDKWFGGHRNGSSGLQNPNTSDIQRFKSAWEWTRTQIGTAHQCDNVRFWVNVPAIFYFTPDDAAAGSGASE